MENNEGNIQNNSSSGNQNSADALCRINEKGIGKCNEHDIANMERQILSEKQRSATVLESNLKSLNNDELVESGISTVSNDSYNYVRSNEKVEKTEDLQTNNAKVDLETETPKLGEKRKSNLLPLDVYFASDDTSHVPVDNSKAISKKIKISDASSQLKLPINAIEQGEFKGMSSQQKLDLEGGELPTLELEEGEIVEVKKEQEESSENTKLSDEKHEILEVQKQIPIDYGEFNRKRKVALLLAYCGAGFHGMQKNPDVETIELKLMEALTAIGAIPPDVKTEFLTNNNNQLSFNRAARTDKGVSAARQVVSLKLKATESFLEDVNKHLPKEIKVFSMERVTKSFDAKCSCSGRCYEYLVPSLAFAPSKDILDSSYRLSDEQLGKLNEVLGKYVGTHNFHNFTSGKRFTDLSATRYITEFKAGKPFECRGHEFIALEVKGQSFLIHQIRKMIGLCMAICRGYCPIDTVDKSWKQAKLDIPKAPGLGLLLNRVNFKSYNDRFGGDGQHNPLSWENVELDVERYKIEYLWHSIIEEEIKKSSIVHWLKTLNNHTYTESGMSAPMNPDYKGKKGVYPSLDDKRRCNYPSDEPLTG